MPQQVEFSLSNRCNLGCIMCDGNFSSTIRREAGMDPMPNRYGPSFVDDVTPFLAAADVVKFYGGEPFYLSLNFDLIERLDEVNASCQVVVTTNGTIVNDRVRSVLNRLGDVHIVVSLDSASTQSYESIRRRASFRQVMANLAEFVASDSSVSLAVCPMVENRYEMGSLIELADQLGVEVCFNVVWTPRERSLRSLPQEELTSVIEAWHEITASAPKGEDNSVYSAENRVRLAGARDQLIAWRSRGGPSETVPRSEQAAAWAELIEEFDPNWPRSTGTSDVADLQAWAAAADLTQWQSLAEAVVSFSLLPKDEPDTELWRAERSAALSAGLAAIPDRKATMSSLVLISPQELGVIIGSMTPADILHMIAVRG